MRNSMIESPDKTIVVIPKIVSVSTIDKVSCTLDSNFQFTVFIEGSKAKVIFRYDTVKEADEGREAVLRGIAEFYDN
jgi:hypothetical protein